MQSFLYWNNKLPKTQTRVLRLEYEITGAKTVSEIVPGGAALVDFDAITQAEIDDHLGSSSEFAAAKFDATAMGDDHFGGVIDMKGQVQKLALMRARCYSGTAGATLVEQAIKPDGMTASTTGTEAELSDEGNIAFKVNFGNTPDFDGLTAGLIEIEFHFIGK